MVYQSRFNVENLTRPGLVLLVLQSDQNLERKTGHKKDTEW